MTPETIPISRRPMSATERMCCCLTKTYPEGFSWRGLPAWLKLLLLCRCLIAHTLFWVGWFMLIFYLIFNPNDPKFTVTNASLTRFNINSTDSSSATLLYNLAFNITIRNPNRSMGMYYHRINVSTSYTNKEFGFINLVGSVPIYQGHKNTTFLPQAVLQGQKQLVKFGRHDVSQFNKETATGVYSINVQVTFRIKIRYGKLNARFFTPGTYGIQQIDCKLKIPLRVTNHTSTNHFKATRCSDAGIILSL